MRTSWFSASLILLSCSGSSAGVVYTPTNGPTCKELSKSDLGEWICPGPGGYVARFSDEGNVASVAIGPGPQARGREPAQVLGAGKVFGDKIQWIVVNDLPRAAVLRMWHRAAVDDDRNIQTLEVFLVEPNRTCAFGSVDARQPNANEIAMQRAEQAAKSNCTMK
jgi:hypothetical protein